MTGIKWCGSLHLFGSSDQTMTLHSLIDASYWSPGLGLISLRYPGVISLFHYANSITQYARICPRCSGEGQRIVQVCSMSLADPVIVHDGVQISV